METSVCVNRLFGFIVLVIKNLKINAHSIDSPPHQTPIKSRKSADNVRNMTHKSEEDRMVTKRTILAIQMSSYNTLTIFFFNALSLFCFPFSRFDS